MFNIIHRIAIIAFHSKVIIEAFCFIYTQLHTPFEPGTGRFM